MASGVECGFEYWWGNSIAVALWGTASAVVGETDDHPVQLLVSSHLYYLHLQFFVSFVLS